MNTDPIFLSKRTVRKRHVDVAWSATSSAGGNLYGSGLHARQAEDASLNGETAVEKEVGWSRKKRVPIPFGAHPEHRMGSWALLTDLGDPALIRNVRPRPLPTQATASRAERFEAPDGDNMIRSGAAVGAPERDQVPLDEVLTMHPVPPGIADKLGVASHSELLRSTRPNVIITSASPAVSAPESVSVGRILRDVAAQLKNRDMETASSVDMVLKLLSTIDVYSGNDGSSAFSKPIEILIPGTEEALLCISEYVSVGVLSRALCALGYFPSLDDRLALAEAFRGSDPTVPRDFIHLPTLVEAVIPLPA